MTDFKFLARTARHQAEVCTDHFDKVATALTPGQRHPAPQGSTEEVPLH